MIRENAPWSHTTELCYRPTSRSSCSPEIQPSMNSATLEDYWEDASVCLRSFQSSYEEESTAAQPAYPKVDDATIKIMARPQTTRDFPCVDSHEFMETRVKRRRSFPPPLAASCTTLSIKGGGRFVLIEMVQDDRPQGFFRAERENGRLRLHLVLPDHGGGVDDDNDGDMDDRDLESCTSDDHDSELDNHTIGGSARDGYGSYMDNEVDDTGRNTVSCNRGIVGLEAITSYGVVYAPEHQDQEPCVWRADLSDTKEANLAPPWSPNRLLLSQSLLSNSSAFGLATS